MTTTILKALCALAAGACARAPTLAVGDVAPPFKLAGSDGKIHDSSAYRGKYLVLAWFPKAHTRG